MQINRFDNSFVADDVVVVVVVNYIDDFIFKIEIGYCLI